MLESLLKGNGYEVLSAENGREALEKLKENSFNLIISDILMPVMDGYQLCHAVKNNSRLKKIPFVFYSATYTDSKDRQLALDMGADRYIQKPMEPQKFTQIIREVIEKSKKGELVSKQGKTIKENEVLKLYSERLVKKLENKMLDLEASEERFRRLYENVNDVVFSLNEQGRFTSANSRTELFGYKPKDVIEKHFTDILTPSSKKIGEEHFRKAQEAKSDIHSRYEVDIVNKDGSVSVGELSISSVYEDNKFKGRFGIIRDITERKKAEKQIKKDLETKNVLLKEVHHRVKNNLQIIISLMRLQTQFHENEQTKEVFRETQSRIHSMALIHENLYKTEDFARIDLGDYIQKFCTHILHLYQADPSQVDIKIDTEKVYVDITQGIPCALILNELISNAVKYAFPGKRIGRIEIELRKAKGDKTLISIGDNGIGLPEEIDFRKPKTLGLQLINDLSKQLNANLRVQRKDGLRVTFTF